MAEATARCHEPRRARSSWDVRRAGARLGPRSTRPPRCCSRLPNDRQNRTSARLRPNRHAIRSYGEVPRGAAPTRRRRPSAPWGTTRLRSWAVASRARRGRRLAVSQAAPSPSAADRDRSRAIDGVAGDWPLPSGDVISQQGMRGRAPPCPLHPAPRESRRRSGLREEFEHQCRDRAPVEPRLAGFQRFSCH
jgi:hypothetical protein